MVVLGSLVIFALICVGAVILQVFLSKKDSKWPGLILPGVFLLISLAVVLAQLLFMVVPGSGVQTLAVNGEIIYQTVLQPGRADVAAVVLTAVYTFLLMNIPTVILIFIYAGCRGKHKRLRDLEKMSAQDL